MSNGRTDSCQWFSNYSLSRQEKHIRRQSSGSPFFVCLNLSLYFRIFTVVFAFRQRFVITTEDCWFCPVVSFATWKLWRIGCVLMHHADYSSWFPNVPAKASERSYNGLLCPFDGTQLVFECLFTLAKVFQAHLECSLPQTEVTHFSKEPWFHLAKKRFSGAKQIHLYMFYI